MSKINDYNQCRNHVSKFHYIQFLKTLIKAHNDLIRKLRGGEFDVVLSQSFNDELTTQLEALKDKEKDIRIILGNFNETWARQIALKYF